MGEVTEVSLWVRYIYCYKMLLFYMLLRTMALSMFKVKTKYQNFSNKLHILKIKGFFFSPCTEKVPYRNSKILN